MVKQLSFWANKVLSKPVVILISGKAGTGKDTFANILVEELQNCQYKAIVDHFAFAVKQAALEYFGWDGNKDAKGRLLLQNIGRIGRLYDPCTWAKELLSRIDRTLNLAQIDVLIIPDWRFPNEKKFIEMTDLFQILTVRMIAPTREIIAKDTPEYLDTSETALDSNTFNIEVFNTENVTLDDLRKFCKELVNTYFKKE
jgi:hypothetical protein